MIMCALFQREFGIKPEDTMRMNRETREVHIGIIQEWKEIEAEMIAGKLAKAIIGKR